MKIYKFPVGINQTNCYFAVDGATNYCAVIDPGDEAQKLIQKIEDKGLTVKYIILTHGHFDHIMALTQMRKKFNAPVVMHKADDELITDVKKSYLTWVGISVPCEKADIYVDEGDTLEIGESTLRFIHTPGHTQGSICIINGSDIFTGDTLFKNNIGRYDLYGGDYETLCQSLKKLAVFPDEFKIYPGHGDTTTIKAEKENNIYF